MTVLLDIGNSRLKWATVKDGALRFGDALEHAGNPTAALAAVPLQISDAVWLCHVTGSVHEARLIREIETRTGGAPRIARVSAECAGLRVAYAEPQRLGVDRWLMMLAIWTQLRAPFCVVSAGTALTFDAVDAQGQHLGGVIAPGLSTMQQAVLGATRFDVRGQDPHYDDSLGSDTERCVRQGAAHACAGLIERLARRHPGAQILSGGDARSLQPLLAGDWELRPQLVLEGLLAWGDV
jgi:type III pantothenate kinase